MTTDAQGLVSLEDELEITQTVEEEAMLEEAYRVDAGVSIEMPTREKNRTCRHLLQRKPSYYGPSSEKRLNFCNVSRSSVSLMLDALRLWTGIKSPKAEIYLLQTGHTRTKGMARVLSEGEVSSSGEGFQPSGRRRLQQRNNFSDASGPCQDDSRSR